MCVRRIRCLSFLFAGLLTLALSANAAVTRNLDYAPGREHADNKDHLDVHMPDGAKGAPVVVYFHGGALMFGDKQLGDEVAQRLLPLGIGVVSPNYRLSPGVKHPIHTQDAAAAFAWTVRHIAEYGGDPGRVMLLGILPARTLPHCLHWMPPTCSNKELSTTRSQELY
jgi:acetyl esterase/lipase